MREPGVLPTVIVFAKAPIVGSVKTRLIPRVGAERACTLHAAFVADTLAMVAERREVCRAELHVDRLVERWQSPDTCPTLQVEGDLGARMLAALESGLRYSRRVVILGSDSPSLPAEFLDTLLASRADVCLGPADDGGFYAISCQRIAPTMFAGVTWSSQLTLKQTQDAIAAAGLTSDMSQPWYDIDDGADLDRLAVDPGLRSASAEALQNAGWDVGPKHLAGE